MVSNGFIIVEKDVELLKSGSFVRFIPTSFHWFLDFQKSLITLKD
jgi:hypothetical protein